MIRFRPEGERSLGEVRRKDHAGIRDDAREPRREWRVARQQAGEGDIEKCRAAADGDEADKLGYALNAAGGCRHP